MILILGLAGVIALLHVYFFVFESFLWKKRAAKLFRFPQEKVDASVSLASNQGFYNAILSAGLIWAIVERDERLLFFFFSAVACAGLWGALTASKRILYIQTAPAVIGLVLMYVFVAGSVSQLQLIIAGASAVATVAAALASKTTF